ncbi:MAG: carbohydrate ABC transporter substrate-binding protein [Clostridiaceae bacterium]|nr:carbohydrate ABC transporter substrate-binding protein [Clostridiaceae bacterium]
MLRKTLVVIGALAAVYACILFWMVNRRTDTGVKAGNLEEPEVLTVWYWDDSLVELFEEFAGDRENLSINYVNVPNYEYAEKLRSAISFSEDLPDICLLQDKFAGDFLNLDLWEDLGAEAYGLDKAALPKDCLPYITSKSGTLVAAPYNLAASGLAYRAGMMERVFGLSKPDEVDQAFPSWEELIERGAEYKKMSPEPFFLFSSLGDVATVLYNQTERAYVEDGRLVEPERFLRYYRILHSMYDEKLVDDMSQCSKEWYDEFEKGRFLFSPWSMWLTQNKTFSKNDKNDWKLMVPPEGSYKWGGCVCAIPSESTHKETAWEFIKFMALSEEGARASKEASCSQFLCWKKDTSDKEYQSMYLEGFGDFNVGEYYFEALLPDMYTRDLSPYDSAIDVAYHTAVKAISHDGGATPEQSYAAFLELLHKAVPDIQIDGFIGERPDGIGH